MYETLWYNGPPAVDVFCLLAALVFCFLWRRVRMCGCLSAFTIYLLLLSLFATTFFCCHQRLGRCWVARRRESRKRCWYDKSQQELMGLDEGLRKESASEVPLPIDRGNNDTIRKFQNCLVRTLA